MKDVQATGDAYSFQNLKFFDFFLFLFWVIVALLDPDPLT
jgi:hypothetical protein